MTAPSPFYRQHHEIEDPAIDERQFRPGFQVIFPIDTLLTAKLITREEHDAAVDFRELYEIATPQARSALADFGCGGTRTRQGDPTSRHDAARRLNEIENLMRPYDYKLLELSVIDNLSWLALGRRLDLDHRTARKHVAAAIRFLAIVA